VLFRRLFPHTRSNLANEENSVILTKINENFLNDPRRYLIIRLDLQIFIHWKNSTVSTPPTHRVERGEWTGLEGGIGIAAKCMPVLYAGTEDWHLSDYFMRTLGLAYVRFLHKDLRTSMCQIPS